MKNLTRSASTASRPAAPSAGLRASWPEELHQILRDQNIRQVAYVPDSGHARLIDLARADRHMRAVPLTTEEEGVALAAGAWLGGEKSVLLLQSSGVGNCINMLGTVDECRVPLLMLVTMRGQWGEFNPWQVPMAQGTAPALSGMGVVVRTVDDAQDVAATVEAAARLAFNTSRAVAVLIGQRVIGTKEFGK
jgi:sulfopyruvate decarboxylase alpha subunit